MPDQPDNVKRFPLANRRDVKRTEVKSTAHDVQRFYPTAHDVDKRFTAMIDVEFPEADQRLARARQINAWAADGTDPREAAIRRDRAYQLFPGDRW